jgi:uncharacterized protein
MKKTESVMIFDMEMPLKEFIKSFDSVVIAFSGGVDSSTLSAICYNVLKDKAVAVTAISPTTPSREIKEAVKIAKEIGIKHEFIDIYELESEGFVQNSPNRCYYCKKHLISALVGYAKERGYSAVFEGTNASELDGHRPGYKAVKEFSNVYSPWAEFGFTKEKIREMAKMMGYSFYDKPSQACLASRIPFGSQIDEEKLRMIDEAESMVIEIAKVRQIRIRNFDGMAIIEVGREERQKLMDETVMDEITEKLKKIGFKYVLLDLEGYRTGKLSFLFR